MYGLTLSCKDCLVQVTEALDEERKEKEVAKEDGRMFSTRPFEMAFTFDASVCLQYLSLATTSYPAYTLISSLGARC